MEDFYSRIRNTKNPEIINWINSNDPYVICDLLEQTGGGPYLKELEDAIIKTNDIVQIYEFLFLAVDMKIPDFDQKLFEGIIIESKNPKLMCYCIGFVPGINLNKMVEALINTHNSKYMEMILTNEEYEDILPEVQRLFPNYNEEVEKSKQYDYFPTSLEEFKEYEKNISLLKQKIIETKNPHLITELANYIEYLNEYKGEKIDISDLTLIQEEIGDPMQVYEYLASVDLKERTGLINSAVRAEKPKFLYYIHEYVPNLTKEEMDLLEKNIIKKNPNGKYAKLINNSEKNREEL